MLENIKLALRYNNNIFDDELRMYIEACKNDLIHGGVNKEKIDDEDESVCAIVLSYCKWFLNFEGKGEAWEKIYRSLKASIVLDSRYK